ncbi:MAG TPA: cytochrome P450 [Ktedonobacterales bacterium]|nr:cytochrome P450 [Ktedonobacterales bacterium]
MTITESSARPAVQRPNHSEQRTSHLPGPPWHTAVGNTLRFLRHALDFSQEMRNRYGDVVSVPTLMGRLTLVFHPDGVRRVLQENHLNYNKDIPDYRILSLVLGKGLLTNDGESWLQQRRLIQPAFHRDRIAALGTLITDATAIWLDQLEAAHAIGSGRPLDIPQEMSRLTLSIVCKALFGTDLPAEALERVSRALTTVNHLLAEAFYLPGILSLPTPQRHRLRAARRELHAVVDTIIQQRRESGEERGDLLAMLLDARDAETGVGMSNQQLRDEILTLLLAGHETTANTLSWTFYLLAQHPDTVANLQAEYRDIMQGRLPKMDDLPQLPLTRMVVEESMRLYPPAWAVGRNALAEDEIGGYVIPKRAYVLVFQYVTQRHPDFWERPDAFDPGRFAAERATGRHRFAYFPFGGGPHLCIGNQFAMIEAQLILATVLSRYQLLLSPTARVIPEPLVTLRPGGNLSMTIYRREEEAVCSDCV